MADLLFSPSLTSERMRVVVSDRAWAQAMLDVEIALANVEARLGLIPPAAAKEIEAHGDVGAFDLAALGQEAVKSANPVVPLISVLRASVSKDSAPFVHVGATSQDILDSAMMLTSRHAMDVLRDDLRQAAGSAAALAERHRHSVMAGRTLLQQASVTSFGLKAARWLVAISQAYEEMSWVAKKDLVVQLGGSVGTLAAFRGKGIAVMQELASELELGVPALSWHTDRTPMLKIAMAVALAVGSAGKVALDLVLLGQTEIAEVRASKASDRGRSSAMPQKQNPVEATEILAAVRGAMAQVGVLLGSLVQEHERAAGAWQAEWSALSELFLQAAGATSRLAVLLGSLEVDPERMHKNLDAGDGLVMAEHLTTMLAERTDPGRARAIVEAAVAKCRDRGVAFRQVVEEDAEVRRYLKADEIRRALDPRHALGESSALIDRALESYRKLTEAT